MGFRPFSHSRNRGASSGCRGSTFLRRCLEQAAATVTVGVGQVKTRRGQAGHFGFPYPREVGEGVSPWARNSGRRFFTPPSTLTGGFDQARTRHASPSC